jgi:hypothetical protein
MATPVPWIPIVKNGTLDEVEGLFVRHPDLAATQGPSILAYAAKKNRVELLSAIVAAGVDVDGTDNLGTPLVAAAFHNAVDAAAWLLDHGAGVNRRPTERDSTPLHVAVCQGHLEMAKLLLDRGADPNLTSGNPARNAVAAARTWGKADVVAFLESRNLSDVVVESELVDIEAPSFRTTNLTDATEWFEQKWEPAYEYVIRRGLDSVSKRNRVLFLVGYLIDQLCDGGATMVYVNPSAEFIPEMPAALTQIGAKRAAKLIRDLNALFPEGLPAHDFEVRQRQLASLPTKASVLGTELERIFDEWTADGRERVLIRQLFDFYRADQ